MPSTTPGHTFLSRLRKAPAADWVRRRPRRLPPQAVRSTRRPQGRRPLSLATATVALTLTLTFAAVPFRPKPSTSGSTGSTSGSSR